MHELAIAESVVETVTQRLPDAKVTCVCLEVGALSGVVPDSIRFCFDLDRCTADLGKISPGATELRSRRGPGTASARGTTGCASARC